MRSCVNQSKRLILICVLSATGLCGSAVAQTTFYDSTNSSGIVVKGRSFGASWGDLNGDGLPDLWVGNHRDLASIYLNSGSGFLTDVIPGYWLSPLTPDGHGAAFADIDNDGDQDVFQLVGAESGNAEGPNLFLRSSPGSLNEETAALGLSYPLGRGRTPLWLDWDGDGMLDVFLVNISRKDGEGGTQLLMQRDGVFRTENSIADFEGGLFAQLSELRSDGVKYVVLHNQFKFPAKIFRLGDTTPTDRTAELGMPRVTHVQDVAIEDFNGDLRPDILLSRIDNTASQVLAIGNSGVRARLLLNQEQKEFSFRTSGDVTVSVGPEWQANENNIRIGSSGIRPRGRKFTLSHADPDVVGIQNHTPGSSFGLYIGFEPTSNEWTVLASRGGRLDINISVQSTASVSQLTVSGIGSSVLEKPDRLLLNTGSGFTVASDAGALSARSACESVTAADFDNDMDIDLYFVCRTQVSNLPNRFLLNDGHGKFSLMPNAGGAAGSLLGRGETVASADYDNDGFIDLLITNGNGEEPFVYGPYQLFRNEGNGNHWLAIELQGTNSNRDAIGARVVLTANGISQVQEQSGGMHRLAQDHDRLHFGLGPNIQADEILVEWPDGSTQTLKNVSADQILLVTQEVPIDTDTDGDGLTDDTERTLGTDPANPDTDGGGTHDGVEVTRGTDPLNPADDAIIPASGSESNGGGGLFDGLLAAALLLSLALRTRQRKAWLEK